MMRLSAVLLLSLAAVGCASGQKSNTTVEADKVVARSDDRSSRPDWVTETVSVKQKNSDVQFIGVAEVPGDSRAQAAFKMSDAAARGNVANKIETNIVKIVESSETGLSMEDQKLKSLVHEMSQISLRNVDVADRYWEKVERTATSGEKSIVMKVFSLIEMKKDEIEKMILEKAKASKAASADVRSKVENVVRSHWDGAEIGE